MKTCYFCSKYFFRERGRLALKTYFQQSEISLNQEWFYKNVEIQGVETSTSSISKTSVGKTKYLLFKNKKCSISCS